MDKKTITSVLATRTEKEVSEDAKGTNSDEDEVEDGVGVNKWIEYDTDSDRKVPVKPVLARQLMTMTTTQMQKLV